MKSHREFLFKRFNFESGCRNCQSTQTKPQPLLRLHQFYTKTKQTDKTNPTLVWGPILYYVRGSLVYPTSPPRTGLLPWAAAGAPAGAGPGGLAAPGPDTPAALGDSSGAARSEIAPHPVGAGAGERAASPREPPTGARDARLAPAALRPGPPPARPRPGYHKSTAAPSLGEETSRPGGSGTQVCGTPGPRGARGELGPTRESSFSPRAAAGRGPHEGSGSLREDP